jgi:hypothetical protein
LVIFRQKVVSRFFSFFLSLLIPITIQIRNTNRDYIPFAGISEGPLWVNFCRLPLYRQQAPTGPEADIHCCTPVKFLTASHVIIASM